MSARESAGRWLAGAAVLALLCVMALLIGPPAHADPLTSTATTARRAAAPGAASPTLPTSPAVTPPAGVATPQSVSVAVGSTLVSTEPLPAGFLGFSIEYSALHAYLGRNPKALNPVFLALLTGIDQGHQPILRVGGNSSDNTWIPLPGVLPPLGVSYTITPDWLATVRALVRQTDTRLILGVNLAADDPQIAGVEARALVAGIGQRSIEALEIGNEPDLYLHNLWYDEPDGTAVTRRAGGYTFRSYTNDVNHWRAILPNVPVATGAVATLNFLPSLLPLAPLDPDVKLVTVHRYPLTNCGVSPTSPQYPTQANLLSAAATSGLAAPLGPYAQTLHADGIDLRVDELNSASCEGAVGVSDTFASALWVVDALFNLAAVDVDGVNIHTLPGSNYAPFTFNQSGSTWTASVRPLYYGLAFFAAAFPPGAELLSATNSSSDSGGDVKSYTTLAPNGTLRTTIINEDAATDADVTLTLPGQGAAPLSAETLSAPSLGSTTGVQLGGATFADPTPTGVLAAPQTTTVAPANGSYSVVVPAHTAVLLTTTG